MKYLNLNIFELQIENFGQIIKITDISVDICPLKCKKKPNKFVEINIFNYSIT